MFCFLIRHHLWESELCACVRKCVAWLSLRLWINWQRRSAASWEVTTGCLPQWAAQLPWEPNDRLGFSGSFCNSAFSGLSLRQPLMSRWRKKSYVFYQSKLCVPCIRIWADNMKSVVNGKLCDFITLIKLKAMKFNIENIRGYQKAINMKAFWI